MTINIFVFYSKNRYELMPESWREHSPSHPSFFQVIDKLEVIMQRDTPYLGLNKHIEAHPYYNVPCAARADEEVNTKNSECPLIRQF